MKNKEEQLVLSLPMPPKAMSLGTSVLTTQGFPICKATRPEEISAKSARAADPHEKLAGPQPDHKPEFLGGCSRHSGVSKLPDDSNADN